MLSFDSSGYGAETEIPEQGRLIGNIFRFGVVTEVDYPKLLVRVGTLFDEEDEPQITTNWIPFASSHAGDISVWAPPVIGESVLLLSEGGELNNAIAIPAAYGDLSLLPEEEDRVETLHRTQYKDGLRIEYDQATHKLLIDASEVTGAEIVLKGARNVAIEGAELTEITASNSIRLVGEVIIEGNLYLTGTIYPRSLDGVQGALNISGNPINLNPGSLGGWESPPDLPSWYPQ